MINNTTFVFSIVEESHSTTQIYKYLVQLTELPSYVHLVILFLFIIFILFIEQSRTLHNQLGPWLVIVVRGEILHYTHFTSYIPIILFPTCDFFLTLNCVLCERMWSFLISSLYHLCRGEYCSEPQDPKV